MLFPRLITDDDGEYDSDASLEDVSEQEMVDAATAAAKGDMEGIKEVPLCIKRNLGGLPLIHLSAQTRHPDMCEYLIKERKQGVDDRGKDGATALHVSCGRYGSDIVALKLLKYGANPCAVDHEGWSALHCAARAGRFSTCWLLLQCGADISLKETASQHTASNIASRFKKTELSNILMQLESEEKKSNHAMRLEGAFSNHRTAIDPVRHLLLKEAESVGVVLQLSAPPSLSDMTNLVEDDKRGDDTENCEHEENNEGGLLMSPNTDAAVDQIRNELQLAIPLFMPITPTEPELPPKNPVPPSSRPALHSRGSNSSPVHGLARLKKMTAFEYLNKLVDDVERGHEPCLRALSSSSVQLDDNEEDVGNGIVLRAKALIQSSIELKLDQGQEKRIRKARSDILYELLTDTAFETKSRTAFATILETLNVGLKNPFQPSGGELNEGFNRFSSSSTTSSSSSAEPPPSSRRQSFHGGIASFSVGKGIGVPVSICAAALAEVIRDVLAEEEVTPVAPRPHLTNQPLLLASTSRGSSRPSSQQSNMSHGNSINKETSQQHQKASALRVCLRAASLFADLLPPSSSVGGNESVNTGISSLVTKRQEHKTNSPPIDTAAILESSDMLSVESFVLFSRFVVALAMNLSSSQKQII